METWRELNNSNRFNNKFLTVIADEIRELINKGYYNVSEKIERKNMSLKDVLLSKKENYPIITEIKFSLLGTLIVSLLSLIIFLVILV